SCENIRGRRLRRPREERAKFGEISPARVKPGGRGGKTWTNPLSRSNAAATIDSRASLGVSPRSVSREGIAPAVNGRPWLFLMASALFEVVWIVSLKLTDGFARLAPLALYLASGLGCAVCLSIAMRAIPMGTAYAVWMGASVVGALLVDVAFFKEPWNVF